jgi:hypothetical protein
MGVRPWTGFILFRRGSSDTLFGTWQPLFGVPKMWGISVLVEQLLASQESLWYEIEWHLHMGWWCRAVIPSTCYILINEAKKLNSRHYCLCQYTNPTPLGANKTARPSAVLCFQYEPINKGHVEYLSLTALDGLTDEMKCYAEHITQPF